MNKFLRSKVILLVLSGCWIAESRAQLTLVNSPYSQNFDAIGSGLPTGWDVRTGASASALGTSATFVTTATSWGVTTGQFRNSASATGLTSASTAGEQFGSTNRAMSIRQTGNYGDPGGAFYLQLTNTVGKTGFKLDFLLQSLDVASPRATTWKVEFGTGASPTSFTTVATSPATPATGGLTFSSNLIEIDFGSQLDNINDVVWIRILPAAGSTGSGARPTSGIDDVSLEWSGATVPSISVNPSSINMGSANLGANSANQSYTLNAMNLTGNLDISVAAPFSISADGTSFGSSLSYTTAQMASAQTVYVRFSPSVAGTQNANIVHSSAGAENRQVAVTGEGMDPLNPVFNFNTCTVLGAPGSGFVENSVTGAQLWQCTSFGRNSSNGVQINGFSGGAVDNEDWLISPAFDLSTGFNIPILQFWSRSAFSGPGLEVLVSTNYSGSGNPNAATWTALPANLPAVASDVWTLSDNIDLSAYKVNGVYIAFKYTSSPALGASRWTLDDVSISNAQNIVSVSPAILQFGEQAVGGSTASQPLQVVAKGIGDVTIQVKAGWEISANNTLFTPSIVVAEAAALAGVTIYARFSPQVRKLSDTATLQITGTGFTGERSLLIGSSFPRSQTLDIAGWNMMFFGSNSNNTATPAFIAQQRANAQTVFENLKADLVGVSEVSNDGEFAGLMSDLTNFSGILSPRWSYSFQAPDPNFPPQKIGFAYNNSTLQLMNTRVMFEKLYDDARGGQNTIPNYPGGTPQSFWASGRLPFMATFTSTIAGVSRTIRAIVIHGKAGGASVDDYNRRVYDAQILKDSLDTYYANDHVVLLGDYNDDMIVSIFNSQASPYKPFVDDATNYEAITSGFTAAGKSTFIGSGNGSAIDHHTLSQKMSGFFIAGSAGVEDARLYIPSYSTTTSDHLPVFSRYNQDVTLPVTMLPLQGYLLGTTAQLQWKTPAGIGSSHFEIERSLDGRQYDKVGKVNAMGSGAAMESYSWKQEGLSQGAFYYRVRQFGKDGSQSVSNVVTLRSTEAIQLIGVYPNPVYRHVTISLPAGLTQANWKLTTAEGRVVAAGKGNAANMASSLQTAVPALKSGWYLLQVQSNLGSQTIKLIKN